MTDTIRRLVNEPWALPATFATWNHLVLLWLATTTLEWPPQGQWVWELEFPPGLIVAVVGNVAIAAWAWTTKKHATGPAKITVGVGHDV